MRYAWLMGKGGWEEARGLGRLRFWERGLVFGLLLGAASCGATKSVAAQESAARAAQPAPHKQVRDRNAGARLGLMVGGTLLLGLTYGLPCAGARGLWCIPVAGPPLVIAKLDRRESRNTNQEDGIVPPIFAYTAIGFVSVLQLGGIGMFTIGALLPRRDVEVSAAHVMIMPLVGRSLVGVSAALAL